MIEIISIVSILLVAFSAYLGSIGFKGKISTIGVDLGTSYSVVAIEKNNKIEIVTDKLNNKIFPSIVSFQNNSQIYRLYDAIKYLSIDPINTIYNSKRFLGKNDSYEIRNYSSNFLFNIEFNKSSNYSNIGFRINNTGYNNISSINYDNNNNPLLSPEYIGSEILRGLLSITYDFIGHKNINKAIITVPAKFTLEQRLATVNIYNSVGLKVIRIIEEPTAAAIAYNLHKNINIHHIIVYDFGGGTLDVSLLYVSNNNIQVYATDGDESLGGSDFDNCILNILINKLHNYNITDNSNDFNENNNENINNFLNKSIDIYYSCNKMELKIIAEDIKKLLSANLKVILHCSNSILFNNNNNNNNNNLITFSKNEFESKCSELFDRSIIPVDRLLSSLEMSPKDIDELVLIGGTTRIPHIKFIINKYFNNSVNINDSIDPDITVAYGAATVVE